MQSTSRDTVRMTQQELDSIAQWLMRARLVNYELIPRNATTEEVLRRFLKDNEYRAAEEVREATELHDYFGHSLKLAADAPLYLPRLRPEGRRIVEKWQGKACRQFSGAFETSKNYNSYYVV